MKMDRELVLCFFMAMAFVFVAAEPKKTDQSEKVVNEHISALYVKDNESGELRFLTGSGAAINQLITQKQDALEQLRPPTGVGGGVQPIIVDLNGGIGSTSGTTPVTTGSTGGGSPSGSTGAGGGGFQGAAIGASPIADLLPQFVGQAVAGGGTAQNRRGVRRRGTKRRGVQRRPGNKRRRRPNTRRRAGNKKKSQVYVVRPRDL